MRRHLTVEEFARRIGVARRTVYRRIADGSLPAVDVGRGNGARPCWRISQETARAFERLRLSAIPIAEDQIV